MTAKKTVKRARKAATKTTAKKAAKRSTKRAPEAAPAETTETTETTEVASLVTEVATAANLKQKSRESRQKFLVRLVTHCANKMDDETWGTLSDAAQEWINTNAERITNKEDVVDPDAEATADAEPEATEPKATKAAKKTTGKKAGTKAEKKAGGSRDKLAQCRRIIIKAGSGMTFEAFAQAIEKKGIEIAPSTARATHWHTVHMLRIMIEDGLYEE